MAAFNRFYRISKLVALGGIMNGCLAGENKQFFDVDSLSSLAGGGILGGALTTAPSPSITGNEPDSSIPISTPTPVPYVCNPLDVGANGHGGVKGKLFYFTPAEAAAYSLNSVDQLLNHGHTENIDFFSDYFNVPTRAFDSGFALPNGDVVRDADGNPLFENFAFHFTASIQLPQTQADKKVQFAVLADDGAKLSYLKTNSDGSTTKVLHINNDGTHAPRLGCGGVPVQVSSNSPLKVELDYYQGPRYHIALILLWREWTENSGFDANDPWCGQTGTNLYFDSTTTPSTAQPAWNDLMTRWEVVPTNVFKAEANNPCDVNH